VGDEGRIAADGAEGADGGVDAAGKEGFGTELERAGLREGARHLA
jgi:hypothetical protein